MFAPTTQIGDLLHHDHMATIALLEALERLLSKNRKPPAVDEILAATLRQWAALLRAEVEAHFGFEEQQIFPLFLAQGQNCIVEILTQEHQTILPLAQKLVTLAENAATQGRFTEESWAAFRLIGGDLIEREMFHLQKEEMGLLAGIAQLVDPATDAALAQTFTALKH